MALTVKDFANKVRERKPEYRHLDDTDLMQMVVKKKPELLKSIDRVDLANTMKQSRAKTASRLRQKEFGALSGYSRFMAGTGEGMLDIYHGVKQLVGGDVSKFQEQKKAYMEASEGDKTAAAGEIFGAIAATAPTMLIPGVGAAGVAAKLGLSTTARVAAGMAAGTAAGAGVGFTELVDEGETRLKNTLFGGLFGAGGTGAGMLIKKVGTKAFNALKGQYKNASVQELMDLSKKHDIPLSKADITGEGKATEKALETIPVVGMGGFRKKGAEKVQTAIQKEAKKVGADWDETIQTSLATKAKAGKAQAKIDYDKVEELSSGVSIKPQSAIDKAAKHEKEVAESIMGSETNPFSKIRENLGKKDRTFSDLRKDRSDLGKAAKKASDSGDRNLARQYQDIKSGVEEDIEKLVSKKVEVGTVSKGEYLDPPKSFSNTKIVDEYGDPERVYHGTTKQFDKYDVAQAGEHGAEYFGAGIYFSNSRKTAKQAARGSGIIREDYLNMQNPLTLDMKGDFLKKVLNLPLPEKVKKEIIYFNKHADGDFSEGFDSWSKELTKATKESGHDGIKVLNKEPGGYEEYIIFDPNKIATYKTVPTQDPRLKEAFGKAQKQYKEEVIPYTDRKIMNALKTDTPDEIFDTFMKKGKGDKAKNFYNLLDDKGKKALRDGFMDNAIEGATSQGVTSPAKLAGYLERMTKPINSVFKGKDLEEVKGFAKIMRHAEKYGQLNEAPSNGMALIPYLKGGALISAGAGAATSPMATGAGVLAAGALTKLISFMKTKGKGFGLASGEIGSKKFEEKLAKFMAKLPIASAATAKEIKE